jgi:hypothetical protein
MTEAEHDYYRRKRAAQNSYSLKPVDIWLNLFISLKILGQDCTYANKVRIISWDDMKKEKEM